MTALDISRETSGVALPYELSSEILANAQEASAAMQLFRRVSLPGGGLEFQTITGDPNASWVDETDIKPISEHTFGSKKMKGYTLSIIEPFSNQFARDKDALFDEMMNRLPARIGKKFDETVFGINGTTPPGENFDTLTGCPTVSVGTNSMWDTLVTIDKTISDNEGLLNGWAITPLGKSALLTEKDANGRPLFIDSMNAQNNVASIMGHPTYVNRNLTDGDVLGFAGDWTSGMYGVVEDIHMDVSSQTSLTSGDTVLNLWERNMFAVRIECEIGFIVKDKNQFVKITK